ncbi:MAG: hypothetical protein QXJ02_06115 [Candidatus Bathyarchaeia archaeon]
MSENPAKMLVKDFLKNSWPCVEALVRELSVFEIGGRPPVCMYSFKNGVMNEVVLDGKYYFLRSSVEYSNPQLTVEEVQGIVAARLLEACANYFCIYESKEADDVDVEQICEALNRPPSGIVLPFLLNTDETEPDRYSMNPLKQSIVDSGQSAFPSASVKTEQLRIDNEFARKYEGSLICKGEIELIERHLETCNNSYLNLVDAVKYDQLELFSEFFGIDLRLYSMRLPLSAMEKEEPNGPLHHIIRQVHAGFEAVKGVYDCMGRSIKNRTTLLTVPHSKKGYGSKRAARGKVYFDGQKLKSVRVTYKTTKLYPNAIDPNDVSIAKGEDDFMVEGEKLANYDFKVTPSSPQFFLYSLVSPENAALWHGVGAFGAQQLLGSYASIRSACARNSLIKNLSSYGISVKVPLQFNLIPQHMWFHPVHRNIDASIGCVSDLNDLVKLGMKLELLPTYDRQPREVVSDY